MKKMEMPVGQKVKGYGLLNEYGEFEFIPEQTGIRQGQTKLVKQGDNYTVSSTKNSVIIHVRLLKQQSSMELLSSFCKVVNVLLQTLRDYEFV